MDFEFGVKSELGDSYLTGKTSEDKYPKNSKMTEDDFLNSPS
ncbi:hypothetical protein [Pseudooceanicola sp.]